MNTCDCEDKSQCFDECGALGHDAEFAVVAPELIDGKIPPHTECPYKDQCGDGVEPKDCYHTGKDHIVSYSCALARAYEILKRNS